MCLPEGTKSRQRVCAAGSQAVPLLRSSHELFKRYASRLPGRDRPIAQSAGGNDRSTG
mgnify:CR=1 FL=1